MRKALYVIILLGAILDPYNAKSQQWSAGGSVPISVRDFVLACSKEGGVWLTFCLAYIQGVSSYAHGLSDSGYTQLFYPGFALYPIYGNKAYVCQFYLKVYFLEVVGKMNNKTHHLISN